MTSKAPSLTLFVLCIGCRDAQMTVQPQVPIMYVAPGGSGIINVGGPSAAPVLHSSSGANATLIHVGDTQCSTQTPCSSKRLCVLTPQGGRCSEAEVAVDP